MLTENFNKIKQKVSLKETKTYSNSKLKAAGIKELEEGVTLEMLQQKFPWLFNAKFKDLEVYVDGNKLEVHGGEWSFGVWEDGKMFGVTWKKGRFKNGSFDFGTWKDGTFLNGNFIGDKWEDGTFKGGNFYGRWMDGNWDGGNFEGIWKTGIINRKRTELDPNKFAKMKPEQKVVSEPKKVVDKPSIAKQPIKKAEEKPKINSQSSPVQNISKNQTPTSASVMKTIKPPKEQKVNPDKLKLENWLKSIENDDYQNTHDGLGKYRVGIPTRIQVQTSRSTGKHVVTFGFYHTEEYTSKLWVTNFVKRAGFKFKKLYFDGHEDGEDVVIEF